MQHGRATLTLANKELLRGVDSFVLLEGFGRRLRESVTRPEDDEYQLSFQVERLDMFLSHSWHAWWLLKYVCVLLHFNSRAAFIAAVFVGLCVAPVIKKIARNWDGFEEIHIRTFLVSEVRRPADVRFVSLFMGILAFYITLFSWHHIRRLLNLHSQSIFLDKVCIHQTDASLKALGIQSIGAFLDNCSSMVITWDETYFERLWCTFELAAFHFRGENRPIVFLPISLSALLAIYGVVIQCSVVCRIMFVKMMALHGSHIRFQTYYTYGYSMQIPLQIIFVHFCRAYGRGSTVLKKQVDSFSVRHAKCFCCCNNHINPDTGATIPCDRQLVYQTIAHWYGHDDVEIGLENFDQLIRCKLSTNIRDMTPGWARAPYEWTLVGVVATMLAVADERYDTNNHILNHAFFVLSVPICYVCAAGFQMAMSHQFPALPPSEASTILRNIGEHILTVAIAVVPTALHFVNFLAVRKSGLQGRFEPIAFLPYLSVNVILSILFYSNWNFFNASNRKPSEEVPQSAVRQPSFSSNASSRSSAPPPQLPEASRRRSARSHLARRQSSAML